MSESLVPNRPPPTPLSTKRPQRRHVLFCAWLAICLSVALISAGLTRWTLVRNRNTNTHLVNELGHAGYLTYDTLHWVGSRLRAGRLRQIDPAPYEEFLRKLQARTLANASSSSALGKHLIFLQMESVDGFAPNARYRGELLMPFLHSLQSEAVAFSNTVDNTAAGRTVDSELLALSSIPPIRGEVAFVHYDMGKVPSVPRILSEAGYSTFSIHGYRGAFWNRQAAHRAIGFEKSYFRPNLDDREIIGWGISDCSILRQSVELIEASDRPVFAHIVLLTNHHPYQHVGHRYGHLKPSIVENHIDSLRYVDRCIKDFFATMRERGLLENSIVAVYADHDSGISAALKAAVDIEYQPLFSDSVPFMIYGLDREPQSLTKPAALQDLPVIALLELGLPLPPTFVGNPIESDEPVLSFMNKALDLQVDKIAEQETEVDLAILSKLAILRPESLAGQK